MTPEQIRHALVQRLESLQRSGVQQLPRRSRVVPLPPGVRPLGAGSASISPHGQRATSSAGAASAAVADGDSSRRCRDTCRRYFSRRRCDARRCWDACCCFPRRTRHRAATATRRLVASGLVASGLIAHGCIANGLIARLRFDLNGSQARLRSFYQRLERAFVAAIFVIAAIAFFSAIHAIAAAAERDRAADCFGGDQRRGAKLPTLWRTGRKSDSDRLWRRQSFPPVMLFWRSAWRRRGSAGDAVRGARRPIAR